MFRILFKERSVCRVLCLNNKNCYNFELDKLQQGNPMKIRITKKKSVDNSNMLQNEVEQICERRYEFSLEELYGDKTVRLFKRWRKFLHSLDSKQRQQIRIWACPATCTPREIDRLVKATKGSLEKALK